MKNKLFSSLILCTGIALFFVGCTNNPFFHNNKIKSEKITGTVRLDDDSSPENVFVWLEGYNLSTWTDTSGVFSLQIPSASTVGLSSSYSGDVYLYFFVENYLVDSIQIIFNNGLLDDDQDNIDDEGKLMQQVELKKFVNIDIIMNRSQTYPSLFKAVIEMAPVYQNTVVQSLRQYREWPDTGFDRTGLIIQSVDNPDSPLVFIDLPNSEIGRDVLLMSGTTNWEFEFWASELQLEPGTYRLIPFLLFVQRGIPGELKKCLPDGAEEFGEDYLALPIKRNGGEFVVL